MESSLHVAVVGLSFGRFFAPIYQAHPGVGRVSVFDPDAAMVRQALADCDALEVRASFEEILADRSVDAVHVLTPVPLHVAQTLETLNAGKHCACAVPMASSLEDIERVIVAAKASGRNYMMMETGLYCREFFYAQSLIDGRIGENQQSPPKLGEITFLRGDYYQDLEAPYGDYWRRVPPMHYATHCVAPLLALARTRASKVSCIGSGRLRKDICDSTGNPFPIQTAHFRLEGTAAAMQINRSWYQLAHSYTESFSVYGDRAGFEWQQLEAENPVYFELPPVQHEIRWRDASATRVEVPYRPDLVPEPLAKFAFKGHGGSHPHLVHEFVSSILEGRPARIDPIASAEWCAPGICAHESSLKEGEWIAVPSYRPVLPATEQ